MARGGYRAPANPAVASGPGALSQRTDGGPTQGAMPIPDAAYGEQAEFQAIQGGAPMAAVEPPLPLSAPTTQPNVPVTNGLPFGPGSNTPMADPLAEGNANDMRMVAKYLPQFQAMAKDQEVPDGYRRFLMALRFVQ